MSKEHSKRTLMAYSKEDLVNHCMALEHNNIALRQQFEIQYRNCMKIIEDMNALNERYKDAITPISALKNSALREGE